MTIVLACVNLKGGVGKTTIAVSFAAYCGRKGFKTLLIDVDPQTNATFSCIEPEAWSAHAKKFGTVASLLGVRGVSAESTAVDVKKVILKKVFKNVDLIPSHIDLFSVDLDLGGATGRELKLRKALKPVIDNYDLIVCDCPPNLTIPTQNAIAMSTHYVVPVPPDYLSSIGVALLVKRIEELCESLDHKLEHAGIIISRVGRTAYHRENIVASLRAQFGGLVLNTELKDRVAVSESAASQRPVFDSKDSQAVAEFESMSKELLGRLQSKVTK
jgi:chromosome partitioning protein